MNLRETMIQFVGAMSHSVVLRAGVVAVVMRFLGVPALAGIAIFRSGVLPSVVLAAALDTVLWKGKENSTCCNRPNYLDNMLLTVF